MALYITGIQCELREVALKEKPQAMLDISPKGTVPVLVLADGTVIDESLDIMLWAMETADPEGWMIPDAGFLDAMLELIQMNDSEFKFHLDRYKYPERFELASPACDHFRLASGFLSMLEKRLQRSKYLFGSEPSLADAAIFPFVRQFAAVDQQAFESLQLIHLKQWLLHWQADRSFQTIMLKQQVWHAEGKPIFLF